jgi:hypothetical protein
LFTVREDTQQGKIIKQVVPLDNGSIKYESFMFRWPMTFVDDEKRGPFRLIYNNFGNCTAWKLNSDTGIWGCFADQNDIGFDRKLISVGADGKTQTTDKKKKHTITLSQQTNEPTQLEIFEAIEDKIADAFFELMWEHVQKLFEFRR